MMERVLIITNGGDISPQIIRKYESLCDTVIACDGGLHFTLEAEILPDYVIGDLDSYNEELPQVVRDHAEIILFPREKNDSDTALAIAYAKDHGAKYIYLVGAWGSRADHTLSHVFFLKKERAAGIHLTLVGVQNELRWVQKGDMVSIHTDYPYISLIPVSSEGIKYSTKGLYYEAKELRVELGSTRGVSNEMSAEQGEILIHSGEGLLIYAKDKK